MSLALLFHYLMLNMFRMLIHPSSGACDLFDELFRGLYCSGSMCVGVTVWFGWGGVVSGCRLQHSLFNYEDAAPSNKHKNHMSLTLQQLGESKRLNSVLLCMLPCSLKCRQTNISCALLLFGPTICSFSKFKWRILRKGQALYVKRNIVCLRVTIVAVEKQQWLPFAQPNYISLSTI